MFEQALHLQCKDLRLILKLPTSTRQVAVKYLKHCNQTYPSQGGLAAGSGPEVL